MLRITLSALTLPSVERKFENNHSTDTGRESNSGSSDDNASSNALDDVERMGKQLIMVYEGPRYSRNILIEAMKI